MGQIDGYVCDTRVEEWLNMEVTEICTCVTGLTGRKDALEVQKTSGTAVCSAVTFQVALGKSLFHTQQIISLETMGS